MDEDSNNASVKSNASTWAILQFPRLHSSSNPKKNPIRMHIRIVDNKWSANDSIWWYQTRQARFPSKLWIRSSVTNQLDHHTPFFALPDKY